MNQPKGKLVIKHNPKRTSGMAARSISGLLKICWRDGTPWVEANQWVAAQANTTPVMSYTLQNRIGHLQGYANWLEREKVDWRHFPAKKSDQVLYRYRGALTEAGNAGLMSMSTAAARIKAVILFYQYCLTQDLVKSDALIWRDQLVPKPNTNNKDILVLNARDERAISWLIEQAGLEAVQRACQMIAGGRKLYPTNLARLLGLTIPQCVINTPLSAARERICKLRALLASKNN